MKYRNPLFDPRYIPRYTAIYQPGEEMEVTFPSGGLDPTDLPLAGPPLRLPPPLVEGQTIGYLFYDDQSHDAITHAVAVKIGGALQWSILEYRERPRQMVGTYNVEKELAKLTKDVAIKINQAKNHWLKVRAIVRLGYSMHYCTTPEEFKRACAEQNMAMMRRVHRDREELWVNGKIDSAFFLFGSGRPVGTFVTFDENGKENPLSDFTSSEMATINEEARRLIK